MLKKNKYRKVFKYVDNSPKQIAFEKLRKGDFFIMYEPDGTLVKDEKGNYMWQATTDPKDDEDKVSINTIPIC